MEVIVIDDGCQDRTIPIIKSLFSKTDLKLKVYPNIGSGLTMARQTVVNKSCGYFVAFIDGDMVLSKDFIQKQVELMEKTPSLGAAQGTMKGITSNSSVAELEDLSNSSTLGIGVHRNWKQNLQQLGTGGSIFRVAAINAVGGFDTRIKGAAEDADLTVRIRLAGFSLCTSEAIFEHEYKKTLNGLWKQYVWYGYGLHYFYHKHKKFKYFFLTYFWPITYAWGLVRAVLFFKATRRKIAFFLPSHNFFRATAFWFGFYQAHLKGYGHEYRGTKNR